MVNNSTNINDDISHQIIEHRKEPKHMTLEFQFLTWYMHTYVASRQTHICSERIDTHMWGVDKHTYVTSGQTPICGEWANTNMWRVERHTYVASRQTHICGHRKCTIHILQSVQKITIVLFKTKRHIPKHRDVNLTSN